MDKQKKVILALTSLLISLPAVFAGPADILEGPFSVIMDVLQNDMIVFGLTVIFFFMLLYGIFAGALHFVPAFKSDKGISRPGKVIAISLAALATLSTFYLTRTKNPQEVAKLVLTQFGLFGAILLSLMFAAIIYFGVSGGGFKSVSLAALALGFGLVLSGHMIDNNDLVAWGMLLIVISGLILLIMLGVNAARDTTGLGRRDKDDDEKPEKIKREKPEKPEKDKTLTKPPSVVQGLQGEMAREGENVIVNLKWGPNPQEDEVFVYEIHRKDEKGWNTVNYVKEPSYKDKGFFIKEGDIYAKHFEHIHLNPELQYIYRVKAINVNEELGPWSQEISVGPLQNPVPPTTDKAPVIESINRTNQIDIGSFGPYNVVGENFANIKQGSIIRKADNTYLFQNPQEFRFTLINDTEATIFLDDRFTSGEYKLFLSNDIGSGYKDFNVTKHISNVPAKVDEMNFGKDVLSIQMKKLGELEEELEKEEKEIEQVEEKDGGLMWNRPEVSKLFTEYREKLLGEKQKILNTSGEKLEREEEINKKITWLITSLTTVLKYISENNEEDLKKVEIGKIKNDYKELIDLIRLEEKSLKQKSKDIKKGKGGEKGSIVWWAKYLDIENKRIDALFIAFKTAYGENTGWESFFTNIKKSISQGLEFAKDGNPHGLDTWRQSDSFKYFERYYPATYQKIFGKGSTKMFKDAYKEELNKLGLPKEPETLSDFPEVII